jgi:F-type H+-transporting ATPase subunit a
MDNFKFSGISGPKVYVRITELFRQFEGTIAEIFGNFGNLITQTTVSLFVVTVGLIILGFVAGRKLKKRPGGLQVITEKLVTMLYNLVEDTMGKHNLKFAPYIGTLFLSSLFGSLIGTTGLFRSATADLSVTLAWALVTSVMVWYCNIKNFGVKAWLKGYTEPIFVMTPMNLIGEVAQPLSMAFRHFGNVAGGSVLTTLIYDALAIATSIVFGWLPGILGKIPFLQAGIPAVLSLYFDFFSGFVQAFVFCLLTMIYVGSACPPPEEVKAIREANKKRKSPKAD